MASAWPPARFQATSESDLQLKSELHLVTAAQGLYIATHRGVQLGVGIASDTFRHHRDAMARPTKTYTPAITYPRSSLGMVLPSQHGMRLLTANGEDLTDTTDPSRKMMCQVTGAFAKYEKMHLVEKLAAARRRKQEEAGKCERRKTRLQRLKDGKDGRYG